jgi:uncharacterized membrane protein (DUF106 family)
MSDEEGGIVIHDRRKGWYDNRITTGNVITLLGMLTAVVLGWSALDKNQEVLRVRFDAYVNEQARREEVKKDLERIRDQLTEMQKQMERRR